MALAIFLQLVFMEWITDRYFQTLWTNQIFADLICFFGEEGKMASTRVAAASNGDDDERIIHTIRGYKLWTWPPKFWESKTSKDSNAFWKYQTTSKNILCVYIIFTN
jgi:hypothetical protein